MMYRQLPVFSPLGATALSAVLVRSFRRDAHPHAALGTLLRREYAADAVVLCGTGTQALQVAIVAALRGRSEPGMVALPAFSCFDVASAAVGAGVRIALYDLDPASLAPDLDSLETALRSGAGAVVVAPLYGIPVACEPVVQLALRYGARVIEDAAQGHGAGWRGRPLGSLGEISVLSFGRGKGWTGVRGGALLLRGQLAAEDCGMSEARLSGARGDPSLLLAGTSQWLLARPRVYGAPASIPWLGLGETRYREPVVPTRMSRAAAALALATYGAARQEAVARREHGRALARTLAATATRAVRRAPVLTIPISEGGEAGYLRFPLRVLDGPGAALSLRRLGVAPSYPSTLAELAPVQPLLTREPRAWPGAQTLVRELITLPCHSLVTGSERDRTIGALTRDQTPEAQSPPGTALPEYSGAAARTR